MCPWHLHLQFKDDFDFVKKIENLKFKNEILANGNAWVSEIGCLTSHAMTFQQTAINYVKVGQNWSALRQDQIQVNISKDHR